MPGGMIDVNAVPVPVLVKSFLTAMAKHQAVTAVVFQHGDQQGVATNRPEAEAMARSYFSIQDGAIEVAAIALHASRLAPEPNAAEPAPAEDTRGLCSIVVCAGHELVQGKPVTWDDLPDELREAHRLVAKAVIGAAVAHKPEPKESRIIKPV